MARLMYDSVNAGAIPTSASVVGGYTDGLYRWSNADWGRFPNATKVRICAVSLDMSAHVADIESGALTIAQGVRWVELKTIRKQHPSLYFSVGLLPQVQAALRAAGLDPFHSYALWAALWDGKFEQWDGAVAHQYAGSALSGHDYDLSWVSDYWPGVDPLPPPPAPSAGGATLDGWDGLSAKVDVDIPAFGRQLGVLASGLQGIG